MMKTLSVRRARLRWCGLLAVTAVALSLTAGPVATASSASQTRGGRTKAITPARGTSVTKSFFGMHSFDPVDNFPGAPIGSLNLTASGVYWPSVETSPGHFDFTRLDAVVDQAEAHGAKPLLVLAQTPAFYSTDPTSTPIGATVPDMSAWETYVRTVVQRYGTRVEYQPWTEPNVKNNWNGTVQQLADLMAAGAKIIHHEAPGSTVVAPPMVLRLYFERQFMKQLYASKVGGVPLARFFDVVTVDPYPLQAGTPENALTLTTWAQRTLARAHVKAPLWVNEINYGVPVGGRDPATVYSDRTQVAYVARTFLLNAGLGVQRVYWLGWFVYPTLGVSLVEPDQVTMTPAGRAFELTQTWLLGQSARGCFHDSGRDLYSCAFVRDGHTSWAYWTGSGRATVKAPQGARKVQTAAGETASTRLGRRISVTSVPVWVTH